MMFAGTPAVRILRDSPAGQPKYVRGQFLVKYRKGVARLASAVNAQLGLKSEKEFANIPGLHLVQVDASASATSTLRALRSSPAVEYAEPNYFVKAFGSVPSDPDFRQQWFLANSGQLKGIVGADVGALKAWDITKGDAGVVIAVLDSGVDYLHSDLAANMFHNSADCNQNGVDDDGDGYIDDCYGINPAAGTSDPMDDAGHGTHVAGLIGAVGNNALGVAGVNWNVKILPCKFIASNGWGTAADAVKCLDWLVTLKKRGVNIVASNNSWGIPDYSRALADAVKVQEDNGILFIVAAGNDYQDNDVSPVYPANLPYSNVISVAATDRFDQLAPFSNVGRSTVHLGAPGEEIFSTLPGNQYGYDTGTSMSAPLVSGVAALLAAQDPTRDWKTIKNLLITGGNPLPALGQTVSGRRLNAFGSLTCTDQVVTSRVSPSGDVVSTAVNSPVVIAMTNLQCGQPRGPVHASVPSTGEAVLLKDDGIAPDEVAGDGVYTGEWTPSRSEPMQFSWMVEISSPLMCW